MLTRFANQGRRAEPIKDGMWLVWLGFYQISRIRTSPRERERAALFPNGVVRIAQSECGSILLLLLFIHRVPACR